MRNLWKFWLSDFHLIRVRGGGRGREVPEAGSTVLGAPQEGPLVLRHDQREVGKGKEGAK